MGAKNDNAQDDDEDLKEDPISQIDLAVSCAFQNNAI